MILQTLFNLDNLINNKLINVNNFIMIFVTENIPKNVNGQKGYHKNNLYKYLINKKMRKSKLYGIRKKNLEIIF